jgi:hypothetical protein
VNIEAWSVVRQEWVVIESPETAQKMIANPKDWSPRAKRGDHTEPDKGGPP